MKFKGYIFCIGVLASLFHSTSFAQNRGIQYLTKKVEQKNLSSQFIWPADLQVGGTCHVYAASSLAEAACFRTTNKRIDISESYLVYRHLIQSIEGNIKYNNFDFITKIYEQAERHIEFNDFLKMNPSYAYDSELIDFIKNDTGSNIIPDIDEGFEIYDLRDIIHHLDVSTPALFSNSGLVDLQNQISGLIKYARNLYVKEQKQINISGKMTEIINKWFFQNEFKSPQGSKITKSEFGGYKIELPKETDLYKCLTEQKIQAGYLHYSQKNALILLNNNIPFICENNWPVEGYPFPSEPHALIIIGYRYMDEEKNNIEFLVRDSNLNNSRWVNQPAEDLCTSISVLMSEKDSISMTELFNKATVYSDPSHKAMWDHIEQQTEFIFDNSTARSSVVSGSKK